MIKRLAKRLSAIKKYVGFVLGELLIERGEFQSAIAIEKEKLGVVVIRLSEDRLALTVKLIRLTTAPASHGNISGTPRGEYWREFSAAEVSEFIAEVDDDNEIHRGARPIVPGFLIAEALFNRFDCKKIRLRFRNFTAVGEKLFLTVDGERFFVDASERKVEGWILDY